MDNNNFEQNNGDTLEVNPIAPNTDKIDSLGSETGSISKRSAIALAAGAGAVAVTSAFVYGLQEKNVRPDIEATPTTKPAYVEPAPTGQVAWLQATPEQIMEQITSTIKPEDLGIVHPANATRVAADATSTATWSQAQASATSTPEEVAILPTPTVTPAATATAEGPDMQGVIIPMGGETLRVRDHSGNVVGAIAENTPVEVVGRTQDGQWVLITAEDGKEGWVASAYVSNYANDQVAVIEDINIVIPTAVPTVSTGVGGAAGGEAVVASPQTQIAGVNPIYPNVEQIPTTIGVEGLEPGQGVFMPTGFVPEAVNVLKADQVEYKNYLGMGTEAFLANPGVVMISDFIAADGTMDEELMKAYAANPDRIQLINPANQNLLSDVDGGVEAVNVQEGGFAVLSGRKMRIDLQDGRVFEVDGGVGTNWHVILRGYFGDSTDAISMQNTDRNRQVLVSNFVAGHTLYTMYPKGAFIDEEHYKQSIQNAHLGATNCGDGGCSKNYTAMIDLNTGAVVVFEHNYTDGVYTPLFRNFN